MFELQHAAEIRTHLWTAALVNAPPPLYGRSHSISNAGENGDDLDHSRGNCWTFVLLAAVVEECRVYG